MEVRRVKTVPYLQNWRFVASLKAHTWCKNELFPDSLYPFTGKSPCRLIKPGNYPIFSIFLRRKQLSSAKAFAKKI